MTRCNATILAPTLAFASRWSWSAARSPTAGSRKRGQPMAVVPDEPDAAPPRLILEDGERSQWLHPGIRDRAAPGRSRRLLPESDRAAALGVRACGAWRTTSAVPKMVTRELPRGRPADGRRRAGRRRAAAAGNRRLDRRVRATRTTGPSRRSASSRPPSFKGAQRRDDEPTTATDSFSRAGHGASTRRAAARRPSEPARAEPRRTGAARAAAARRRSAPTLELPPVDSLKGLESDYQDVPPPGGGPGDAERRAAGSSSAIRIST